MTIVASTAGRALLIPRNSKNKSNTRCLLLVRHAHRSTSKGRELDNGLSSKGKKQALRFLKYFSSHFNNSNIRLLSSPKKRCIQTLLPLAKHYKLKIYLSKDLLEARSETKRDLSVHKKRISRFCKKWQQSAKSFTVICSHGDWIPDVVYKLKRERISLKKGNSILIQNK